MNFRSREYIIEKSRLLKEEDSFRSGNIFDELYEDAKLKQLRKKLLKERM